MKIHVSREIARKSELEHHEFIINVKNVLHFTQHCADGDGNIYLYGVRKKCLRDRKVLLIIVYKNKFSV